MSGGFEKTEDAGTGAGGAAVALRAGSHLGKYRLVRVLGEGGMGVVWAAHDPDLERAIAIKVLRYAKASQDLRQRLLREARAMAKLKHPNVLTVYEVGTVGDRDYIAMELVDGLTLDGWLALGPTEEERWTAVLAAGRGLAAAHDAGVVHRDFKPHNVLRSREGRVLVTDFGLARGMLGEEESAALEATAAMSEAPRATDALLDSPLTQTGAMIGTPAYMAPEQYQGAPPDPRTDQFAFCVTAWQALTGERPFKGTTLEEMRRSASGGVAHLEAKLPRAVRAVLSRGLDRDAEKRWPSLDVLLDELERAGQQPARRRQRLFAAAALASIVAVIAGAVVLGRPDERAKTGCDDPDQQFAEAWSPALKSELARTTPAANATQIAEQLDRYKERWIESYANACRARPAKLSRQRIACLEGIRDRAAAITTLIGEPTRAFDRFDPGAVLLPVVGCETTSPLAPPRVPPDQPRRGKILRVMGRGKALRGLPASEVAGALDALLAEAKLLEWKPLASALLVNAGKQYVREGKPAEGREMFQRALAALPSTAELRDVRVESAAYNGMLETSIDELEHPSSPLPAGITDPRAKVTLHPELAMRITKATNAAGSDPLLLAARDLSAAIAYSRAAQWNRYASGYEEALRLVAEARKRYDEIGDPERMAYASWIEAEIYLMRGDDRALDDALFAARRTEDALKAAHRENDMLLRDVRATVAFARRDYAELYRIRQAEGRASRMPAPLVRGRVTGDGAHRAIVVAWPLELTGNARNIVMDPREFAGDVVNVESDGTFAINAAADWMIMAESQGARSTPRLVGSGPLSIQLEPTVTLSGQLQGRNWFGVRAFARYAAGANSWTLETPVDKDGTFDLRGLPPGRRSYGTEGPAGTGRRSLLAGTNPKALSWPHGQTLDVIVRASQFDRGAQVIVVRGQHRIETMRDVVPLFDTAPDIAWSRLQPVGANNTDAGREVYRPGDRHAVITGQRDKTVYTVCVNAVSTGAVACKTITVELTVAVEYPDGRFGGGVTPILFEL